MQRALRRLIFASILFLISMMVGTAGFIYIENYSTIDAVYMSVLTFSTVGFHEVNPLSENGKIFASIYIAFNLGVFAYSVSVLSSFIFEGELKKVFQKYIDNRALKMLTNHVIVCGFGKNGEMAARELADSEQEFIVVEKDQHVIDSSAEGYNFKFLNEDATMDDTLIKAGIKRASAIICALPGDSDNVFITLTARELNPRINIIAKATELNTEKKLIRAGASHVVMPDMVGGSYMAALVTKPFVIEFLTILNGSNKSKYKLEEVSHDQLKPQYQNKSLRELDVRNKSGTTILAFKDDKEGFIFNPHSEKIVGEGDVLIVLGENDTIIKFKDTFTTK
ncbi:potassium channel family protein [Marinigracilibium pacificum]|uniref:Potassium channel protein n=1 Tax=Marinigracilibium pacificum TaxID=2729599 RepID=A0A848IY81_9BACT|nr:potassium channel protein [Marinigracilibium pacificum]NMM47204.1 potassium channel protein [Marinigracilibium pacificum]